MMTFSEWLETEHPDFFESKFKEWQQAVQWPQGNPLIKFYFRIKTKTGGIIGNILIEAKDVYEAEIKLRQNHPDCQFILNCEVKP